MRFHPLHRLTFLFTLLLLVCSSDNLNASDAVFAVGHGDYSSKRKYFSDDAISIQTARIVVDKPGQLEGVLLHLGGSSTNGEVEIAISMAGAISDKFYQADLVVATGRANKSNAGYEQVFVMFDKPIELPACHIFVHLTSISENVDLLSDSKIHEPFCIDFNGEEQWYQYIKYMDGTWEHTQHAFLVEALLRKSNSGQPDMFSNVTESVNLQGIDKVREICWVDLDADGFIDLLAGERLYWNRDGKTFVEDVELSTELNESDIVVAADIDLDGLCDIVKLQEVQSKILLNKGFGEFESIDIQMPRLKEVVSYSRCDINYDGYPDLVFVCKTDTGDYSSAVYLLQNNQKNSFVSVPIKTTDVAQTISSLLWTDWDSDGQFEMLAAIAERGVVELTWTSSKNTEAAILNSESVLNTDNDLKTVTFDMSSSGESGLRLSGATLDGQMFESQFVVNTKLPADNVQNLGTSIVIKEPYLAGVKFADFNNDGVYDQFVASASPCRESFVQLNERSSNTGGRIVRLDATEKAISSDAVIIDFNNDGLLDICLDVNGKLVLLQNRIRDVGNYSAVQLPSSLSGVDISSCTVDFHLDNASVRRCVQASSGLLRQGPGYVHVGLDEVEQIDSVVVRTPNTERIVLVQPDVNHTLLVAAEPEMLPVSNDVEVRDFDIHPNPAQELANITFSLDGEASVSLRIYNLENQLVRQLIQERLPIGEHSIVWNCTESGAENPVAPGMYVANLRVNNQVLVQKLIVRGQ